MTLKKHKFRLNRNKIIEKMKLKKIAKLDKKKLFNYPTCIINEYCNHWSDVLLSLLWFCIFTWVINICWVKLPPCNLPKVALR